MSFDGPTPTAYNIRVWPIDFSLIGTGFRLVLIGCYRAATGATGRACVVRRRFCLRHVVSPLFTHVRRFSLGRRRGALRQLRRRRRRLLLRGCAAIDVERARDTRRQLSTATRASEMAPELANQVSETCSSCPPLSFSLSLLLSFLLSYSLALSLSRHLACFPRGSDFGPQRRLENWNVYHDLVSLARLSWILLGFLGDLRDFALFFTRFKRFYFSPRVPPLNAFINGFRYLVSHISSL